MSYYITVFSLEIFGWVYLLINVGRCYLSDNTKAVLVIMDESLDLINDALTELEEVKMFF